MSELIYAKAFLQQGSTQTSLNAYDHLTALIRKLIVERPKNAVDYIEEYSRKLKEEYYAQQVHFRKEYQPPGYLDLAIKYAKLLEVSQEASTEEPQPQENDESVVAPVQTNIMELLYNLEEAGVSIPKNEMFCIGLSIKKLKENINPEKIRFWGKIFGTNKNYYVVEVKFPEEFYEEAEDAEKDKEEDVEETSKESEKSIVNEILFQPEGPTVLPEGIFAKARIPPLPKIPPVKKVVVRPEAPGSGINAKVYYVCNEPWEEWIKLPDVTPAEIVAARQIKLFLTGDLETKIDTYPPFPGTEKNYLRVQIARISAGTQISPLGYYEFDEDEDYEEEDERTQILESEEYEPVSMTDLTDPSMAFWVHHSQHILKQGRTIWWNPKENLEDEEESEEESESEEEEEEEEKEVGPPLLTPLSEDVSSDLISPWSVKVSSKLLPDLAIAVVRSNIWPGALAYCTPGPPQKFENWYMGWGQKATTECYSPPPLPPIQFEYKLGPEMMEILDPTVEEEEAVRIAQEMRKKRLKGDEEEEEGEGMEEEEEEEDEDDDDD